MSDNDLIRRGDVAKILCDAYDDGMIDEGELAFLISEANKIPAVPHEMSAREYARHHGRMCSKAHIFCNDCPIYSACKIAVKADYDCVEFERDYPEEVIAIVGKWAREHPEEANNDA